MPALSARLRVVTLWEVLSVDLGARPELSIPLFAGLSARQARIAALMGRIETYAAGAHITRTGDPGDVMWVVIDGELSVSLAHDGGKRLLRHLSRGALIGEIALFQHQRTADIEAVGAVRMLVSPSRPCAACNTATRASAPSSTAISPSHRRAPGRYDRAHAVNSMFIRRAEPSPVFVHSNPETSVVKYQFLNVTSANHVTHITLNRPEVLNAINQQMHDELQQAFDDFACDDGQYLCVVAGAGERAFRPAAI